MKSLFFLPCILILSSALSLPVAAENAPSFIGKHETSVDDKQAIEHLLATYTQSVTDGNEAAFLGILVDDNVPFMSTDNLDAGKADPQHVETRRFDQFRKSVFHSGRRYEQHFYNVHIDQDGPLAQVSLDFVTTDASSHKGGYGWKTLQLLKVQGKWKIASEFYTAYSLPDQG